MLIVENLTNLDAIAGDEFELVATPLAILGRDGSPVRRRGDRVTMRIVGKTGLPAAHARIGFTTLPCTSVRR